MNKGYVAFNLTKTRKALGWSQEKAAALIGIKRSTLASYEEERALPSVILYPKIVEVYGIIDWKGFISSPEFDIHRQTASLPPLSLIEQQFNKLTEKEKSLARTLLNID